MTWTVTAISKFREISNLANVTWQQLAQKQTTKYSITNSQFKKYLSYNIDFAQNSFPTLMTSRNLTCFCIGPRIGIATLAIFNAHLAVAIQIVALPARTQKVERMHRRIFLAEVFRDFHKVDDEPVDQLIRRIGISVN